MATSPWLGVHLSLGLAILALSFVRFAWRLVDATPHRSGPRTLRALAGLGHFGLYALLVLVPLTGWLGYRPAPFMAPPHLLGIFQMPVISWLDPLSSRTMLTIHSLASWILLVLIGLHVSAALIHTLVLRDSVLRSMVFGARSAQ